MTIEKLHQLITVGSNKRLEHPLDYVKLYLSKTAQILNDQIPFVFMNMQYIQCHLNHRTHRLDSIPTLINKNITKDKVSSKLLEVVAFLKSLQVIDALRQDDLGIPVDLMSQPFVIETICTGSQKMDDLVRFNRHYNILTFFVPDIYDSKLTEQNFSHLKEKVKQIVKEAEETDHLIDGSSFESIMFFDPIRNSFAQSINEFMGIQSKLLSQYEKEFYKIISESKFALIEQNINNFLKAMLLHTLLKKIPYSYQIPVTQVFADQEKMYQGSFLIASEERLTIQQLSVFQIAFNIVMNHLKEYDLGSASVRPVYRKTVSIKKKRTVQSGLDGFMGMIGKSVSMLSVFEKIEKVSRFDVDVLVLGESGTGKDKVAQAIHHLSGRSKNPYIAISLADRPDSLIDSELFGHEKGTFTGAIDQRRGYFERAHGGTLFLDEITYIPQNVQAKLLRVLQNRQFERLGGNDIIDVDVRIITATSESIDNQATRHQLRFLDPLYYRMERYIIKLPALRERKEDIPYLVQYYLNKLDPEGEVRITDSTLDVLMAYHWPGNVRQLFGLLDRAFINAYGESEIKPGHFDCNDLELNDTLQKPDLSNEHLKVLKVLRENKFNIEKTVRFINTNRFSVSRKTLIRYVKEICLIILSNNKWDLDKAIMDLAGSEALNRKAAQKYRSYFFNIKDGKSIIDLAFDDKFFDTFKEYVRQKYESYLWDFAQKAKDRRITNNAWQFTLSKYL